MARKSKNRSRNPYIVVFWEGESELNCPLCQGHFELV